MLMRINLLPVVIAGASLVQYAAASPIRVVVVTSHQECTGSMGHIIRPEVTPTITTVTSFLPSPMHLESGLEVKGHPIFENKGDSEPEFKILPFMGSPEDLDSKSHTIHSIAPPAGVVHIAPGRMGVMGHHHHFRGSFLRRIHHSLMILGPWEGRAVAFVLGCGIGVVLRMMWVIAIVIARAVRGGGATEEDDAHETVLILDAADITPPPQYTDEQVNLIAYDEKAAIKA